MSDHTVRQRPIRQLTLCEVLDHGLQVVDGGPDDKVTREMGMERLRIELTIRAVLGETH